MKGIRNAGWAGAVVVLLLWAAGCAPTNETVDKWAGAKDGAAEVAKIMANPKNDMGVRVYAAEKLIRIRQFEMMIKAMQEMPDADRNALIQASAEPIGKLFETPDLPIQAAAKDTLYMFMTSMENPTVVASARQMILKWYATDFDQKYSVGKFSGFEVLTTIGKDAGPLLLKQLEREGAHRPRIAQIVRKINDPDLMVRASDYIITWFNQQAPTFSKDLIEMIESVCDDRCQMTVIKFVRDLNQPFIPKVSVFNRLAKNPSKVILRDCQDVFLDTKESDELRGIAIEIIIKLGDASYVKALLPILKDERVRWYAFEAAVKLGGPAGAVQAITGINPDSEFWPDDYKTARRHVQKIDPGAVPEVAKLLSSPKPVVVALAMIALQAAEDASALAGHLGPLAKDARVVPGYAKEKKVTVGDLSRELIEESQKAPPKK